MRLLIALIFVIPGILPQKQTIKLRSVSTLFEISPGYYIQQDIDSTVIFNKKKYVVNSVEIFNAQGEPIVIKQRHDMGFLEWSPKEFNMITKDEPEEFIISGVTQVDDKYVYFGKIKLKIIHRYPLKNAMMCYYKKTPYYIIYNN